jgi:hypothetical protein
MTRGARSGKGLQTTTRPGAMPNPSVQTGEQVMSVRTRREELAELQAAGWTVVSDPFIPRLIAVLRARLLRRSR